MTGERSETAPGRLFESLVDQAPDAIIFADAAGAVRLWNAAAQKLFGYAASEVLGGSLDVIIPPRFRDAHWRGFRSAIDSGTTKYAGRALTTRAVHQDGRTLYVDLTFALIREGEAIIGVLAIARDSTESYQSQRALRARVAELETQSTPK